MSHDVATEIEVEFGPPAPPYPHVAHALLQFIQTGAVTLATNPVMEQLVATRLEMHPDLMADEVARAVIESYWKVSKPITVERPWHLPTVPRGSFAGLR